MSEMTYAPRVTELISAVITLLEQDTELRFRMGYNAVKLPVFNNVPQDNAYPYILVLANSMVDGGDKDTAMDTVDLTISVVTEVAGDRVGLTSVARIQDLMRRPVSVRGLVSLTFGSKSSSTGADGVVRVFTTVYRCHLDAVNS